MYPAAPGSQEGKTAIKQDLREFLPQRERARVPDAQAASLSADTYRDLPLDTEHGPYPVVILVHGTASFRLASFSTQALWASRGFVVVAADHPNLYLADYLGRNGCNLDVPREDLNDDVDSELAALTNPSGELAFLAGHLDTSRVALAGHSAGGVAAAGFSGKPGVQLVLPLAGNAPVRAAPALKSVLFVGGDADAVLSYDPPADGIGRIQFPGTQTEAYARSPGSPVKKRIVGIRGGGHLVVTDLCQRNARNQSDLQVAEANGVCGVALLNALGLADCGTVERAPATEIVNYATSAALEETLFCQDRSGAWSQLEQRYSLVNDFRDGN